jgi:uncharacterized membrane protein YbhN (UPF0104 family)
VGLELGQILVVLIILLLAQILVGFLKLNRHYWVTGISVVVLALALQMAIERWPWGEKKNMRAVAGEKVRNSYKGEEKCLTLKLV